MQHTKIKCRENKIGPYEANLETSRKAGMMGQNNNNNNKSTKINIKDKI